MSRSISAGVVHELPDDLRAVLVEDAAALAKWEDITPLVRKASGAHAAGRVVRIANVAGGDAFLPIA